ncbi:MAG: GGDEF domain-containing protein [Leucobacter sp.]
MWRQTDLSLAAASFLLAGAAFALLNATVFRIGDAPRVDLLITAAVALIAMVGVLAAGERFSRLAAGVLMSCTLFTLVPGVLFASTELRALSLGFLFFPFFIFLIWFLPLWFARLLGYGWLALYCGLVLFRYGSDPASVLLVLVVTGAVLGELVSRFKRRIRRESVTDPLCGVWNRRGFEYFLAKAVATSERSGRPLSTVYLDLDGFKAINDRRGHVIGDQTLRDFARDMELRIRAEDVFARFGGDEFALLILDCDADEARVIAERLRGEVADPAWSFGIAEWQAGEKPHDFIARADLGMFADKQRRRSLAPGAGAESRSR